MITPEFGPFLSSQRDAADRRRAREERLRRLEFARQPAIDAEFQAIAEDFRVQPSRRTGPIRAAVTFFRTLNGLRKQF